MLARHSREYPARRRTRSRQTVLAALPACLLPQNLRRKLKFCYKNSGVNYQQECRELALQYLEAIKGVGVYRANSGPNDAPRWEQFKPQ